MKVLFVSKLKKKVDFSPIINSQAQSLRESGLEIVQWGIKQGGWRGYLQSVFELRSFLKENRFDLYHAHYSYSGIVAALARAKPILVSLMGSEILESRSVRLVTSLFKSFFWRACIVKSNEMAGILKEKNVFVIPNGVNINVFKPLDKINSQKSLGFNPDMKHILFMADPARKEKNFKLASGALELLKSQNFDLHVIHDIPHDKIPVYLSAADLLLLTSFSEGSPNVIKEAMACNCPIVATDVGDIKWVTEGVEGCFLTSFDSRDVVEKIEKALEFSKNIGKTRGREKILELGLDSESVANRLISIYKDVLSN